MGKKQYATGRSRQRAERAKRTQPRVVVTMQKPKSKPQSLDLETELPSGHELKGMEDLKRYLLSSEKDRFGRALSEKMLAYALGRSLEFTDEETVDALARSFKRSGYRLRELISQIVATEVFRTK